MTSSLYPSSTLYPSTTLFPGAAPGTTPGASPIDGMSVSIGSLSLTNTESSGVQWRTFGPMEGWDSSVGSSRQVTQKTRGPGGWSGPRNLASRVVLLNGMVAAPTVDLLQDAIDRLNAAVTLEDTILTVTRGSSTRSVICARQDEVLWTEINESSSYWSVAASCADPRKFASALSGTTVLPTVTGGFTFPVTFPLNVASTISGGVCFLTNPGNATGPLVVRFTGPLVAPQINHAETGLSWGTSLSIAAGDYLQLDMEAQTVVINGSVSRSAFITSRNWFGFLPGLNSFYLSAASGYGGMSVTGTPSWL